MRKKHFGAMIWKIFLGMFQFSQIFQISTKAERTFEWKVIFTLLWVPPVSLLESCDTQRRRSSSFSTNTQISRACFQIGKLGKIKFLNNLLKNSPKLSIKARAAVSFRYRNAFLIFTFEPIPSDKYNSTFFWQLQVTLWKYYQLSFELLNFWLPCTSEKLTLKCWLF